jgi:single-stranded DNA-binding protein
MNNKVELAGRIANKPVLRYVGESGKAKVWCILAVDDGEYAGKKRENRIPLILWGDIAEDFANRVSQGDEVEVVNGKLSVSRYKPQGSEEWKEDWGVTVFEWRHTGQQSQGMGSELTFDPNDDVPF